MISDIYSNLNTENFNSFSDETIKKIKTILSISSDIAFTASTFDLFHPGHILMLKDAKSKGSRLVIGLHTDPTINRDSKNNPIQSIEERRILVESCKYIDDIIEYNTEYDLRQILIHLNPAVRVLGSDWENKQYTGYDLDIPIYFHQRTHNWSTSELRKRIADAVNKK